ncbi:unnamed protein product [Nippostrongylus brasiliensis]|uniref:ABC transmembrane type-1 domain-containing protein n=1 Tax=Nippostrongylus brasiliensis TaxID=27835 RepID=A0A0N4XNW4_NIPBR|nr:unnamed protein product [Nippostrongylus brasiliensis]
MFINGTFLELRHFNHSLSKIDGEDDEGVKRRLLQALRAHAKITTSIRELNKLFQVYAFTMIATIIPSILMTLIMFATRLKSYHEVVVMGFPSLLVVLYGFLGMTVSPARLYDEVTSSSLFVEVFKFL